MRFAPSVFLFLSLCCVKPCLCLSNSCLCTFLHVLKCIFQKIPHCLNLLYILFFICMRRFSFSQLANIAYCPVVMKSFEKCLRKQPTKPMQMLSGRLSTHVEWQRLSGITTCEKIIKQQKAPDCHQRLLRTTMNLK